jgi:hypothetical protein
MSSFSSIYMGYVAPATTLLPIITGIVYYKRLNRPLRTLTVFLIFSLLINIMGVTLAKRQINNLPLLHFYTIFELLGALLYYKQALTEQRVQNWIKVIMVIFPILCVVNFTFVQSIYEFNTYTRPLEAIIIIIFSFIYLNSQKDTDHEDVIFTAGKWVSIGFLIYFCSSLFQFIFSNVISKSASTDLKSTVWVLHATFVMIEYVFFYIAIRNGRNK